jgi:hypothetical protein
MEKNYQSGDKAETARISHSAPGSAQFTPAPDMRKYARFYLPPAINFDIYRLANGKKEPPNIGQMVHSLSNAAEERLPLAYPAGFGELSLDFDTSCSDKVTENLRDYTSSFKKHCVWRDDLLRVSQSQKTKRRLAKT